jgi:hypothetical protein
MLIKNVKVVQWTTISIPYIYTVHVVKCVQWLACSKAILFSQCIQFFFWCRNTCRDESRGSVHNPTRSAWQLFTRREASRRREVDKALGSTVCRTHQEQDQMDGTWPLATQMASHHLMSDEGGHEHLVTMHLMVFVVKFRKDPSCKRASKVVNDVSREVDGHLSLSWWYYRK